jgi:nicotinate phosphoribosyltransferase
MADAPELDMAYKLVEYAGRGRMKLSTKKVLYPGRKQVFRQIENGRMVRDVIGRFDEQLPGEPVLQPLLRKNQGYTRIDVRESRSRFQQELARLPDPLHKLEPSRVPYPVTISERLEADLDELRRKFGPVKH